MASTHENVLYAYSQGLIAVSCHGRKVIGSQRFETDSPASVEEFRQWLHAHRRDDFRLIVDHVDEQQTFETVPTLGARDRRLLVAKRVAQRYRDSEFNTHRLFSSRVNGKTQHQVTMMALTASVDLSPWLDILLGERMRLRAFTSPPLLTWDLISRAIPGGAGLLVSANPAGLRQTLVIDGKVHFSRLATLVSPSAAQVIDEVTRSLQYLSMQKDLPRDMLRTKGFAIWLVDDGIPGCADLPAQLMTDAGAKVDIALLVTADLGVRPVPDEPGLSLWIDLARANARSSDYGNQRTTRAANVADWRFRLWVGATATLAFGAITAGSAPLVLDWRVPETSAARYATAQSLQQRNNLLQELATFPTSAAEMRQIVASAERLSQRQTDALGIMRSIARALEPSPDIFVESFNWFPADQAQGQATMIDSAYQSAAPAYGAEPGGVAAGGAVDLGGTGGSDDEAGVRAAAEALVSPTLVVVAGSLDPALSKSLANDRITSLAAAMTRECAGVVTSITLPFDPAPDKGLAEASVGSKTRRPKFEIILRLPPPTNSAIETVSFDPRGPM